jgi:chromate transport protein ChrA
MQSMRRSPISPPMLVVLVVLGVVAWAITKASPLAVVVAVLVGWLIMRIGYRLLAGFGTPVPEPPPPGELRKVRLMYRCSICGTEVRMTAANDEVPDPPRHCQEDMELVTPLYD